MVEKIIITQQKVIEKYIQEIHSLQEFKLDAQILMEKVSFDEFKAF